MVFDSKKLYDKVKVDKSNNSVIWGTPPEIFNPLNEEFAFTVDVAAIEENTKCRRFFNPENDGLKQDWSKETVWCNPPYGKDVIKWVRKAFAESKKGATTVLLIPCRTNTNWWHDLVIPYAEIRFLRGRVRFIQNGIQFKQAFPYPLAIIVYKPTTSNVLTLFN